MATFNVWKGNAKPTRNVWHLTPTNPEPGDTFTVTINGKAVSVTVDSDTMVYDATLGYVPALIASLLTSLNAAVSSIYSPEFAEATWSAGTDAGGNSTYIIATGPEDGKPITVSASASDAGSYGVTVSTIQAGTAGTNEKQVVGFAGSPTGGTFTLTFSGQTTGSIAYNASAATLKTALEALSNIAVGDVDVTGSAGGPWTIEFKQAYAATDVSLITGDGSSLTGACSISVQTTTQGSASKNETITLNVAGMATSVGGIAVAYYNLLIRSPNPPGTYITFGDFVRGMSASQVKTVIDNSFSAAPISATATVTSASSNVYTIEFHGDWGGKDVPNDPVYLLLDSSHGSLASDNGPGLGATTGINYTVVQDGSTSGTNEVQVATVVGEPTGGTFTLTFQGQTTSGIAYNASAATVETALEALSNITDVTVAKSDWSYTVTFANPGSQDVAQMTGNGASLTGSGVDAYTSQAASAAKNEKQSVSLTNNPTGGTFTLTWDPGGGDETTGSIAQNATASAVQTALEGLATPTSGDFSVTGVDGGPWIVEFTGTYAATDVAAMTGDGASLTGSGTQTFTATESVAATGPNWGNNANNWSLGVPTSSHTLDFEDSNVSCLYGINNMEFAGIVQRASFTGHIGLPRWTGTYYEYRNTEFTAGSGAASTLDIEIGEGEGAGSGLIRLNTSSKQTTLTMRHTASSDDGESPAVCWRGTNASNSLEAYRGSIGVAYFKGQTANLGGLLIGYRDNQDSDATVILGEGVTCAADVVKTGSVLYVSCDVPSINDSAGESHILGTAAVKSLKTRGSNVQCQTTGMIGKLLTITGVTQANPAVVTFSAAHGLTTGDRIRVADIVGMTELNQREFVIEVSTSTTVKLVGEDSTSHTAYGSGGVAGLIGSIVASNGGVIDFSGELSSRSVAVAIDVYGDVAEVIDSGKRITTSTYESGEFAVNYHYTSRYENLGEHVIIVRRDGG